MQLLKTAIIAVISSVGYKWQEDHPDFSGSLMCFQLLQSLFYSAFCQLSVDDCEYLLYEVLSTNHLFAEESSKHSRNSREETLDSLLQRLQHSISDKPDCSNFILVFASLASSIQRYVNATFGTAMKHSAIIKNHANQFILLCVSLFETHANKELMRVTVNMLSDPNLTKSMEESIYLATSWSSLVGVALHMKLGSRLQDSLYQAVNLSGIVLSSCFELVDLNLGSIVKHCVSECLCSATNLLSWWESCFSARSEDTFQIWMNIVAMAICFAMKWGMNNSFLYILNLVNISIFYLIMKLLRGGGLFSESRLCKHIRG